MILIMETKYRTIRARQVQCFCFAFCGAAAQRGPWPPQFLGFLITHNDAPQSVGLLWTSDQLVAETSTWQHITLITNIHAPGGNRTHDLSRRAAADLRLRPRGYWDRPKVQCGIDKYHKHNNTLLVKHCYYVTKYNHKDEARQ